jgi:type IV secretion system protein VirD4
MTENIWAINGGLYLGFPTDRTEGRPPDFSGVPPLQIVSDRHVAIIAPSGAGKGRRIILEQLATLTGWSIAVVDFKGEFLISTAEYRAARGSEIRIFNPFGEFGIKSDGFNPVAALKPDSDDFVDDAMGLAEAIITTQGERDRHFPASAQDLAAAQIMYSRLVDKDGGSLGQLRWRLGLPSVPFVDEVKAMLRAGIEHDCEELTTKAGRYRDLTPDSKELLSIISSATTQTRWLDSRRMKADLKKGGFDWAEMKERPITAYLVLPGNRMVTHRSWLKLMLTSMIQRLMKSVRRSKVPVLLLLDEASQLAGLPIIEENMSLFRGYGIKVMSVYQDVPQAQLALGPRFKSYLANAGVLIAFAPQDDETAALLSRRTGQTTAQVMGYATTPDLPGPKEPGGKLNITQAKVPVMLPQDIMNMDDGFALIWTHKTKGTLRSYFPDPSQLPQMADIVERMP